MSAVAVMISRWDDAFVQVMGFMRTERCALEREAREGPDAEHLEALELKLARLELFRRKIVHWFSLMNALALSTLKYGEIEGLRRLVAMDGGHGFPWGTQQELDHRRQRYKSTREKRDREEEDRESTMMILNRSVTNAVGKDRGMLVLGGITP